MHNNNRNRRGTQGEIMAQSSSPPPTVLIADDHPIVRDGLRDLLERRGRFTVIGEAGDGQETLDRLRELRPDVLLLDIEMPVKSGLDVLEEIHAQSIPVAVLILTMYNQESIFNRAMDLGVTGYVLKGSAGADIARGIEAVLHGEYYISPALLQYAMKGRKEPLPEPPEELTDIEKLILTRIVASRSTNQIAEELHRSPRTIEHYRERLCQKLNLSGSYALLRYALEHKAEFERL
jgi:DNA-binding NarL/FixJ family response regulator